MQNIHYQGDFVCSSAWLEHMKVTLLVECLCLGYLKKVGYVHVEIKIFNPIKTIIRVY